MGNRAGRLVVGLCLSIVGMFAVFGSIEPRRTTYTASLPIAPNGSHIAASSVVTPTLEPRAYLPAVMHNFCTPITIPADAKLFGVVFHDYDGDGSQQPGEPGIVGANISVGLASTSSQCNGVYYFRNLPNGSYNLAVTADGFSYISLSPEAFQSSDQPVSLRIDGNVRRDWGLMQGFLTLPFGPDAVFEERYRNSPFGMATVFDLDPRSGSAIAYSPDILPAGPAEYPPWVLDGHYGIDFCISEGTPVLAAMPGIVTHVGEDHLGGKGLWICSTLSTGINYAQYYNHNKEILVEVGDYVYRGQVIAISGNTGTQEFHLHFEPTTCETPPRAFIGDMALDPFATMNPNAPT